ncbi:DoxX family membrane protein [Bacillus sp. PS06]|uniref:DoxX family membrane protein n=1 Tax=Bacillus sp. PS06 TaxID=2764176 RepID=UPI00177B9E51|nr:DoxX family membrane protein [Bacillus sp. PS06]MBD8067764.1 DoxX family membrane protein [Bacillus sp. PS06]
MKKNIWLYVIMIGIMFSPVLTNAHVKWFTDVPPQKESIENILSPLFMSLALLAALVLSVLPQLLPKLMKIPFASKIDLKLDEYRHYSRHILKYGTALALIIQVFSGTIFAPEFVLDGLWETIAIWIAIILLCVPNHYATKLGSGILAILFFYVLSKVGLFHMLDYGFYLAIIFVLLIGKTRLENWGFPFLYLGTGLSLCWVAVEKWVYPAMSADIIQNHGVPTFGFSPTAFIVMAAFIEFIVGYLLVVGILNRILSVVLTLIFISTTMLFGTTEIIGHFMIHVVLVIFIIEGVSFYKPPIRIHKTVVDQMVFVFLNFLFVLATFILIYYRFA